MIPARPLIAFYAKMDMNPGTTAGILARMPIAFLPNLCYIGGGGELAYWLELKSMFATAKVTFPILLLRNSVVTATHKTREKWAKTPFSWEDLFLTPPELTEEYLA